MPRGGAKRSRQHDSGESGYSDSDSDGGWSPQGESSDGNVAEVPRSQTKKARGSGSKAPQAAKNPAPRKAPVKKPRATKSKIPTSSTSGRRRPGQGSAAAASASGGSSAAAAPAAAAPTDDAEDETVMQHVRALTQEMADGGGVDLTRTLISLGYTGVREVAELPPRDVQRRIEDIVLHVAQSIMDGNGFAYAVPNRSSGNQMYVPELDRIVLKNKTSVRPFIGVSTVRKTAIMTRVMQLIHEVLHKNIHTTKRDLFYTDVKLFKSQDESNAVLDDVACMAGCTRTSLHVVASEKGVVVGKLQFKEDGDDIDCSRMGVGGKAIPPFIDKITDLRSDAKFVLLVEKDAAFMRLAEDRFYNKYPCIIITAKGQPDVATRLFLRKVKTTLNIPVLGLVDSDPYGLKILSVYMSGSKNMSYDSASLTTPDIKWLGVRPSDLDKYNIPEQCRLPMTDKDIKTGKDMLQEEFIASNPAWHAELKTMITSKVKAEIQSLSAYGFQYLTEVYLPQKLRDGDWI